MFLTLISTDDDVMAERAWPEPAPVPVPVPVPARAGDVEVADVSDVIDLTGPSPIPTGPWGRPAQGPAVVTGWSEAPVDPGWVPPPPAPPRGQAARRRQRRGRWAVPRTVVELVVAAALLASVASIFPAGHPPPDPLAPWSHRAAPAIAYLIGDIAATEHQLGLTPRVPASVEARLARDVLAARSIGPPPDARLARQWMQALNRLWTAVGRLYAGDSRGVSDGLVAVNQQLLGISAVLAGGS